MTNYERIYYRQVEQTLDTLGLGRVKRAVGAFAISPHCSFGDCFVGLAYGEKDKLSLDYNKEVPGTTMWDVVTHGTGISQWEGQILSSLYEREDMDFRTHVLDWVARKEAVEMLTAPSTTNEGVTS